MAGTQEHGRFRLLNIFDDFPWEYVGQIGDASNSRMCLARYLDQLGRQNPLPMICLRQRQRANEQGHVFLVSEERYVAVFHLAGQADARRVRGKLQRHVP